MKYLSLFSGIGAFECAIHTLFPDAQCIGFSEINANAIKVYSHHFPSHQNLGDISLVTNKQISDLLTKHTDDDLLIVGGFPCKLRSEILNSG